MVEFEIGEGDRGPQARRVRVTAEQPTDAPLGLLGTVSWYEPSKGYGFVSPDDGGDEIFLHSSAIVPGGLVSEGRRVAFLVVGSERGPQARDVRLVGGSARRGAPARSTSRPPAARVWSRATTRTGASASSPRTPEARTSSCPPPSCATARRSTRVTGCATRCARATGDRRPTASSRSRPVGGRYAARPGYARRVAGTKSLRRLSVLETRCEHRFMAA